ncbi:uncharacterized protein LOC125178245 [Hyalella azteca]|uniref:Uncharacterized protein LOC125178245 n=1 Tax=Hyalella azteca TaxID=294128 RepID=A0A979FKJ2_HYAAZ|nr:uncharacterized protein LOC125178245 [Hyalella azteca]
MEVNKYCHNFLMLLVVLGRVTGSQVSGYFSKIRGNVVDKKNCFLKVLALSELQSQRPLMPCGLFCQQTANCRFFCTLKSTGQCALYSSFVAVRWQGDAPSSSTTTYDACYTSWGDPRDIVKTNSPFSYSSVYAALYETGGTDGYACSAGRSYFLSNNLPFSFSQIDMEQITRVKAVIFATSFASYNIVVDVFLSNTSDYSIGQKIGRVPDNPPPVSTITVDTNTSVAGQFITFVSAPAVFYGYGEVQVIPLP